MYYFSTLTLANVLMVLSHIRATESVQLFPYGEMDNALYIGDDDFQSVDLDVPLTYFGTTYTSVYIGTNGQITLQPYEQPTPEPFPYNVKIIAPLHMDLVRTDEPIYWRQTTTNSSELNAASNCVQSVYEDAGTFQATWVLICTWKDMQAFGFDPLMTNTFQAVLATDGPVSYAIFLYENVTIGENMSAEVLDIENRAMNNCSEPGLVIFRINETDPNQAQYNCTETILNPVCPEPGSSSDSSSSESKESEESKSSESSKSSKDKSSPKSSHSKSKKLKNQRARNAFLKR